MSSQTNEIVENACDCGHGVGWHQDTRGCGYKGFNPRHKCPCPLLPYEAVNAVVTREKSAALREAMVALRDQPDADVEVALGGIDWVLAWLRERADALVLPPGSQSPQ